MPGASTLEVLQRAKSPGATARPSGFASAARPTSPTESLVQAQEIEVIPTFRQGDRCTVGAGKEGVAPKKGIVQFVGEISSLGPGLWVGVQLDEPTGICNGRLQGKRFFDCPAKHGGFYRANQVNLPLLARQLVLTTLVRLERPLKSLACS